MKKLLKTRLKKTRPVTKEQQLYIDLENNYRKLREGAEALDISIHNLRQVRKDLIKRARELKIQTTL
jgi:hypothetical protein